MDYDRSVYFCALSKVFAYKCAAGKHLIETLGSPEAIFRARRDDLFAVLHNAEPFIDKLLDPGLLEWARGEVEWARSYGIRLLGLGEPGYPKRLAECDDAPMMLYYKGTAELDATRVLAVVGTRKASWQGREACRRIIERISSLKEKPLIVSGLALGIDGVAHASALEGGLPTVGVLPCGLDEIYPRQHRDLACRMLEKGGLVTDFARGTEPVAFTFLRRNRIIAGLADATLLVESYRRGGGLITASLASSYNREVFAVPGRLSDASFEGCNRLIASRDAVLVADEDALPLAMGWISAARTKTRLSAVRPDDPPLRRTLIRILEDRSPVSMDEMSLWSGVPPQELSVELLELELSGRVIAEGGKFCLSL